MIKNIYKELVLIRKELQAIRKCQESQESVYMVREPYSTNYRLVRAGRNYQAGIKEGGREDG